MRLSRAAIVGKPWVEDGAQWLRRHNVDRARADAYYPGVSAEAEHIEPADRCLSRPTNENFPPLCSVIAREDGAGKRQIIIPCVQTCGYASALPSAIAGDGAIGDYGFTGKVTAIGIINLDTVSHERGITGNRAVYYLTARLRSNMNAVALSAAGV